ncbi:MAG: prenyltransferase/squalene oxidase repeat-containing protein [Planctomycetota bacterium]
MSQPSHVEIVSQLPHGAGHLESASFEDHLREVMHTSPYLVVSVVLHLLVVILFAAAPVERQIDKGKIIITKALPDAEILPPPLPPTPPVELEKPKDITPEPVVTETETKADEDVLDSNTPFLGKSDAPNPDSFIGLGGGWSEPGGGIPGKLDGGGGPDVPDNINTSIRDGLEWLANHQNPEGFWSCAAFDIECGQRSTDVFCDGLGNPQFDVGVTGLSLLAFMGAGHTQKHGLHKKVVSRGLRYLTDVQSNDGNFGQATNPQHTYDHVIATLAMVEAYGRGGRDRHLREPAERALKYLYRIRNPGGAWRYASFHQEMATTPNDMSVTGWAILAMTLAKDLDLPFDETALEDSLLFLEEMTDPVTGVTGYSERGARPARQLGADALWPDDQTEAMTAVGVLCRIFADPDLERPGNREMVEKGIEVLSRMPPLWEDELPGRRDFYYWYYGAYATFQFGDDAWKIWERSMSSAIVAHQHEEGELRGSWDPQEDPWGSVGGRVYSTATLTLCLEVFHRYDTVMDPRRFGGAQPKPKQDEGPKPR